MFFLQHGLTYSIKFGLGTAGIVITLICFDFVTISFTCLCFSFIVTCTAIVWQLQINKRFNSIQYNGTIIQLRHNNNNRNGDIFFNTVFVSSHMYPENQEGTQVIVGSMNMGYISIFNLY